MSRVFLGCFFSSATESNSYTYDGSYRLEESKTQQATASLKKIIKLINNSDTNFWVPPMLVSANSSSHYSTNLLSESLGLYERAKVGSNMYLIDGNLFPGAPEPAPNSLSIMAGAFSVIESAIDDWNR